MTATAQGIFDDMDGKFDARLRRVFPTTRTARSGDQEIVVTNTVATVEARFDFKTLERLYSPNFVAIERQGIGEASYLIFEVVGVNPIHFQMLGMDISMPTVLRREYLDTISESWGKSQETWIDLAAIPTWYSMTVTGEDVKFERSKMLPLAGARVYLLSRKTVEDFLCVPDGEVVGTMLGFELPLTISMENLIRYHTGIFGFSVDYEEPIVYRLDGSIGIAKIGELVDRYYDLNRQGAVQTNSFEVVSFDPETLEIKWSPVQYVFRHKFEGKLLKLKVETGRSVTVTPSHSVFALRGGRIQSVPACTIKKGDYVLGTREIPTNSQNIVKVDLVRFFAHSEGIVLRGLNPSAIPIGFLGEASRNKEWYWRSKGMVPVSSAPLMAKEDLSKACISYKGCEGGLPIELEIDEKMARLIGYYAAEGHSVWKPGRSYDVTFTLSRKDRAIVDDLTSIIHEKFGILPRIRAHGEKGLQVSFSHRCLVEMLVSWVGTGAADKRFPRIILNSPQAVRRAFLRSWVLGDYGVTVSRDLMNGVMHLLLIEGCVGTSSEWTYKEPVVIEGRRVNSRVRYQMKFPSADEISKGVFRLQRKRAEPSYPETELPLPVAALHSHQSHIKRHNLKASIKLIESLKSRLSQLESYSNIRSKSEEAARHDGHYRANFAKYFVEEGGHIRSNQLLQTLPSELEKARAIAQSKLSFLQVREVESVDATSEYVYDVSVPGQENFLAGFGGVFCHNTGVGKSNLTSVLLRKMMRSKQDVSTIVFDVSGEYATHLLDLLEEDGRILSYEPFENAQQLYNSQVIPESLEGTVSDEVIRSIFSDLLSKNLVQRMSMGTGTSALDLESVEELLESTAEEGKSGAVAARIGLEKLTSQFFRDLRLPKNAKLAELDDGAKRELSSLIDSIKGKVNDRTSLYAELEAIADYIETPLVKESESDGAELTPERLAWEVVKERGPRLNVLYLPDPREARMVASRLITTLLHLRKKEGSHRKVLIVLDEAQEYIPGEPRDKDATVQSNLAVEALLRQGRKYRIHCWLATQRVARLNVSALQQLHSYFVSTLPRFYDRMVISESFALPLEVLERTAQLDTGEWIFVSYKATKRKNVPVFLRAEDNEKAVASYLKG